MRNFLLFCIILALAGCGRQSVKVGEQQQKTPKVHISGGSGDSYEDAVVISGALKQNERLDAEYEYISNKHGLKNRDWSVAGQTIIHEGGKVFDVIGKSSWALFPSRDLLFRCDIISLEKGMIGDTHGNSTGFVEVKETLSIPSHQAF